MQCRDKDVVVNDEIHLASTIANPVLLSLNTDMVQFVPEEGITMTWNYKEARYGET